MYKIVVTKILSESEYIPLFLNFYKFADEIYVFASDEGIGYKFWEQGKDSADVKLYRAPVYSNYKVEEDVNKWIWQIIIKEIKAKGYENAIVIFADIDEFVTFYNSDSDELQPICEDQFEDDWIIYRTISLGRYPIDKEVNVKNVEYQNPKTIVRYIETKFPIVYREDLWGDPIYKYPIVKVRKKYLEFLENITPSGGFHRWVYGGKKVVLFDSPIYVTNHVKIINYDKTMAKLDFMLEKCDKDDWLYVHYRSLKNKVLALYEDIEGHKVTFKKSSYKRLLLNAYLFDQKDSYFNNKIMIENIEFPNGSKPHLKEIR